MKDENKPITLREVAWGVMMLVVIAYIAFLRFSSER